MDYHKHYVKSGPHTLEKLRKNQVLAQLRKGHPFHGFICGNRVAAKDIAAGKDLGIPCTVHTEDELQTELTQLEPGMKEHFPELGPITHYYQIVDAELRNKQLRRHFAKNRPWHELL